LALKKVFARSCKENHVGKAMLEHFLPVPLKAGSFVLAPEPFVVGHGLESLQAVVDLQRKGVSAWMVVLL
jgi:hypothetical protein